MLPEALPTPRDPLHDDSHPRRPLPFGDERPATAFGLRGPAGAFGPRRPAEPPLPEPPLGSDVDAFAVEWQLATSGDPGR